MKAAFADSTFYVALLLNRDFNHAKAKQIAQAWSGAVVTTEYVLTEVANHLSGSGSGRATFGVFLDDIASDVNSAIVGSSPELWRRGIDLYRNRADKQWSLTDCISFVVMQDQGATEALTADHHFEQAGFKALLL